VIGFCVVVFFSLIAILAPVISPYPRLFEAPQADRFVVAYFGHQLPQNLTYGTPVIGPTTPLSSSTGGGEWELNYNSSRGLLFLDFLRSSTLTENVSPYQEGNKSITLDVTQAFNVSPLPAPPLTSAYYIVPAANITTPTGGGQTGLGQLNGAIAYFTGRDFIVGDPFTDTLIFHYQLPFNPVWTGEDPASAGNMLIAPQQRAVSVGILQVPVGPYRYFYASDGNQTIVFEISYVHTGDLGGPYGRVQPSGHAVLFSNESLAAPPFVYYNQNWVTVGDQYRSGAGQAILLPLTNNTLEVHNVTGTTRTWIPLTLDGSPAVVAGPIGYLRAPELPPQVYVPLHSGSGTGLIDLDLSSLTTLHAYALPDASLVPIGTPISRTGSGLYYGFYDPASDVTRMIGVNETWVPIPQFNVTVPGRLLSYFEVAEVSKIFALSSTHKIVTLDTVFGSGEALAATQFSVVPPATVSSIIYAGSFGGTLYGPSLTQQELNGLWTDPGSAKTVVFQFLGTIRTPLPPGTYPSGNTYWLGTDFNGHDILTELFYGTQVAFIVGILAALFGVGIGTLVGLISGYYGKITDTLLMRTTDIFLVLPFLPIVLILISVVTPSIWIIIFVLAILSWPGIARVIRAQVLSLKERPFMDAARVAGASDSRLIFLHLAPNVLPFSFLYMSLGVAGAIITEAALSYLGLGDPNVTSWGGMLSTVLTLGGGLYYWWWLVPPGLAITLLSLGFYLLGRGFDEVINPRLRRR
jgi:peptide/nickel transport system permease protein